jgi:hypothetical protein
LHPFFAGEKKGVSKFSTLLVYCLVRGQISSLNLNTTEQFKKVVKNIFHKIIKKPGYSRRISDQDFKGQISESPKEIDIAR